MTRARPRRGKRSPLRGLELYAAVVEDLDRKAWVELREHLPGGAPPSAWWQYEGPPDLRDPFYGVGARVQPSPVQMTAEIVLEERRDTWFAEHCPTRDWRDLG